MNDPDKASRFPIDKGTMISVGMVIVACSACIMLGGYIEKLRQLDDLKIASRLTRIEITVKLIAKQVGIPIDVIAIGAP